MASKKTSSSGAAAKSGTKAASERAASAKASSAQSDAPVTGTPTGAGPDVAGGGGLTGRMPAIREERHGGAALTGTPEPGARPASGQAENTGPVVENTAGGLEFERQRSGTRANPSKEQPTTPERAEIVEARRLEQEIQKAQRNPATPHGMKVGDRIRVLRNAASGWEMGTVKFVPEGGAAGGMAELDGGETVGLEAGRYEPAVGALAAPTVDDRDLVENGGTIDRAAGDADAAAAKSTQANANPARARAAAANK